MGSPCGADGADRSLAALAGALREDWGAPPVSTGMDRSRKPDTQRAVRAVIAAAKAEHESGATRTDAPLRPRLARRSDPPATGASPPSR